MASLRKRGKVWYYRFTDADGSKCERCWNYSVRVGEFEKYPTVCERCIEALGEIEKAAAA